MRKILYILAALFAAAGLAIPAAAAHAQGSEQFCIESADWCLDAWNGGPQVNVYNSNGGANTVFSEIGNSNPAYVNMEFTGNGVDGGCIGDLGNNSSVARAGLVGGCGTSGIGWGGNFGVQFCAANTGVEFYDVHWGGWLGPQNSNGNGTAFYLNKPNPYCFIFS
jgi:hypothetical protein